MILAVDERAKIGICFLFCNFTFQWILFCLLLHVVFIAREGANERRFSSFHFEWKRNFSFAESWYNIKGSTNKSSTTNTIFLLSYRFCCCCCWFYACRATATVAFDLMKFQDLMPPPVYATNKFRSDDWKQNDQIMIWFFFAVDSMRFANEQMHQLTDASGN